MFTVYVASDILLKLKLVSVCRSCVTRFCANANHAYLFFVTEYYSQKMFAQNCPQMFSTKISRTN